MPTGPPPDETQPPDETAELIVSHEDAGSRLDAHLAAQFPAHSRVHLRRAIDAGSVQVDGRRVKVAYRLRAGQRICVRLPDLPADGPEPENIPLEILFEDEDLAAVNKPPRMVVHPSRGHWSGTLTAALAYHFEHLSSAGGPTRPGIVHRLDRDTSGVIVVAKSDSIHMALARQFEERTVQKEYFAIVAGTLDRDADVVELPIGVHPHQREKMAIRAGHVTSRDARTYYEVVERFRGFAAVKVLPKTGRTHQIRVHLAHLRCPVLCDPLYGGRNQVTRGDLAGDHEDQTVLLDRTALHARRLVLRHPRSGRELALEAPLPADLTYLLAELRSRNRT
jgi:23S rRNA pseudouridine1911/1915/1917 synthase